MLNFEANMGDKKLLGCKPHMGGNHTAATLLHQEKQEFNISDACASLYAPTTLWAYPTV